MRRATVPRKLAVPITNLTLTQSITTGVDGAFNIANAAAGALTLDITAPNQPPTSIVVTPEATRSSRSTAAPARRCRSFATRSSSSCSPRRGSSRATSPARTWLNAVRTLSGGLSAIAASPDMMAFVDALLYERRYSLLFEGHRWIDLRRFGRALPLDMPNHVQNVRYPIPLAECNARMGEPACERGST